MLFLFSHTCFKCWFWMCLIQLFPVPPAIILWIWFPLLVFTCEIIKSPNPIFWSGRLANKDKWQVKIQRSWANMLVLFGHFLYIGTSKIIYIITNDKWYSDRWILILPREFQHLHWSLFLILLRTFSASCSFGSISFLFSIFRFWTLKMLRLSFSTLDKVDEWVIVEVDGISISLFSSESNLEPFWLVLVSRIWWVWTEVVELELENSSVWVGSTGFFNPCLVRFSSNFFRK